MSSPALQCYLQFSCSRIHDGRKANCIVFVATVLLMAAWCGQQRGIGKGDECKFAHVPSSISGKPVSCSTRCTGNEAV